METVALRSYPACEADWEAEREIITDHYIRQRQTLGSVIIIMGRDHNFRASEKQYKIRFGKWGLSKNFRSDEAQQVLNGVYPTRRRLRPDADPEEERVRAARHLKRKQARARDPRPPAPPESACPPLSLPPAFNALVPYAAPLRVSLNPQVKTPSMEVDERFLFNLRDYTHEACVYGHWNPEALAEHYSGRQASRSLSSDLMAGTRFFESRKHDLALLHWNRALGSLQNPDLFKTWYHETPIRLLFEIGRVAHHGHEELAAKLLKEVKIQAQVHLDRKDPRHALFTVFGQLPVSQLRDLYERAAHSLRTGLESRVERTNPLLYEVRLNRALDLLWYDAKTDLTKWLPPAKEVDQALEPNNPYSVYFLLLEAYRLVASESYYEADLVCKQISDRLKILKGIPGRIDLWKIGLAYRRLGRQQYEKGRFDDARLTFNTALMYIGKDNLSVLVEIYQYQERLATHVRDDEDVDLWRRKIQQLEEDTVELERVKLPRGSSLVSSEMSDVAPIYSNNHISDGCTGNTDSLIDISSTDLPTINATQVAFPPKSAVFSRADANAVFLEFTNEPHDTYFDDQMSGLEGTAYALEDTMHTNTGSMIASDSVEGTAMAFTVPGWELPDMDLGRSPRSMTA